MEIDVRYTAILAAILITASSPSAIAHEEFRLVGVVTKVSATSLSIRPQGAKADNPVKLDRQTAFARDGKKVARAELKPGQTAVVDAYGDSLEDLLALEVRIVPAVK